MVIIIIALYFYSRLEETRLKEETCTELIVQLDNEYDKLNFTGCSVDSDCIYNPDFRCSGMCIIKGTDIKNYDLVWKDIERNGCFEGTPDCPGVMTRTIPNQCICDVHGRCVSNHT